MDAPNIWTGPFWKATAERAIKTFAQVAGAALVGVGIGLFDVDWLNLFSVAGLAALASVFTSIASGVATGGGPSLTNTEKLTR